MKKKLIGISLATVLLLSSSVSAFASGYRTYTNYQLYANWANNYTDIYAKTTNEQNIVNKVTKLYNTASAVFWACNSNYSRISNTYVIENTEYNIPKTIKLTSSKSVGDYVGMGMEDGFTSSGRGLVSGEVDLK